MTCKKRCVFELRKENVVKRCVFCLLSCPCPSPSSLLPQTVALPVTLETSSWSCSPPGPGAAPIMSRRYPLPFTLTSQISSISPRCHQYGLTDSVISCPRHAISDTSVIEQYTRPSLNLLYHLSQKYLVRSFGSVVLSMPLCRNSACHTLYTASLHILSMPQCRCLPLLPLLSFLHIPFPGQHNCWKQEEEEDSECTGRRRINAHGLCICQCPGYWSHSRGLVTP